MSFFKQLHTILDLSTSACTYASISQDVHQMPGNEKGHFMVDIVGYLTGEFTKNTSNLSFHAEAFSALEKSSSRRWNELLHAQGRILPCARKSSSLRTDELSFALA